MIYAPVMIPTLNRADHLRRCLEALGRCTGAEHTEVYVSLDYPPAEKYVEGYQQVKAMLQEMDLSCFQQVHVFYQEENLGAKRNSEFLYATVAKKHTRYIYTEDDNDFSPNFLEYVNKGLDLFENDPNVIAICGAKDTDWETDGKNVAFVKLYAAYGVAGWLDKRAKVAQKLVPVVLPEKIYGPGVMWKLYRRNVSLFKAYVLGILTADRGFFWGQAGDLRLCDTVYSLYMHLSDGVCIAPTVRKSRTWGNDGSGENMKAQDVDPEAEWPLDQSATFEYEEADSLRFIEANYTLGNRYLSKSYGANTGRAVLVYLLILLCGRNRQRVLRFIAKIKKWIGK